jgi:hypothetical protein
LKIPKESPEEEFEDTNGAPLVSSNSSSDYSFGIFKLFS